jgi:hypothetical protein
MEEETKIEIDEIEYRCFICLEEDILENVLLPCNCSDGYVHEYCLRKWRRRFPNMHVHRVRCAVCKYDYNIPISGYTTVETNDNDTGDTTQTTTRRTDVRLITSIRRSKCIIPSFIQFCYIINILGTFVYFIYWDPLYFLNLVENEWWQMHALFNIQFFQGVAQFLQYAYLMSDPMIPFVTGVLYCYFVVYCPSLLLAGNALFSIGSVFKLCSIYDI